MTLQPTSEGRVPITAFINEEKLRRVIQVKEKYKCLRKSEEVMCLTSNQSLLITGGSGEMLAIVPTGLESLWKQGWKDVLSKHVFPVGTRLRWKRKQVGTGG